MAAARNKTTLRLSGKGAPRQAPRVSARASFFAYWRQFLVASMWFAVFVLLLIRFPLWHTYPTREGEVVRTTVVAPADIPVVDEKSQQADRDALFEKKPQVWVYDREVYSRALQRLHAFFDQLNAENPRDRQALEEFSKSLMDQNNIALDTRDIWQLTRTNLSQLERPLSQEKLVKDLETILEAMLRTRRIVTEPESFEAHAGAEVLVVLNNQGEPEKAPPSSDLLLWKKEVRDELQERRLMPILPLENEAPLRSAIADVLIEVLEPNLKYDPQASDASYQQGLTLIAEHPKERVFKAGEEIARAGDAIDSAQAQALAAINERSLEQLALRLFGIICFTGIFFGAIFLYLRRFRHDLINDPAAISLMAFPPALAVVFAQSLAYFGVPDPLVMLWFPSAMVGMLCTVLVMPQVAFIIVLAVASLFAEATGKGLDFLIYSIFGGFAAVLSIRTLRSRGEILGVGLRVGVVNVISIIVLASLDGSLEPNAALFDRLLVGFMNAILCVPVTLFLLWIFEQLFGVVTDFRLLELSGLKNPLISALEDRAPGTYQHVLNVTKLAEAAADAIGANYLLVRAGAYFHDIGKMVKPKYYSENQVTLEDKKAHSKLTPNMSTLVIKNHVKEGVELARQANLPSKIIDFIPQHHGTGLIKYFYYEALRRNEESEGMDRVSEDDFRYPGPKPQSIETAIVLLADSAEAIAASKFSGSQVNENEIRVTVQEAISDRFNDGQFDECDLTLRDLFLIREAFVRTLMARYHFRIAYPKAPVTRPEPAKADAVEREKLPAPAGKTVAAV